MITNRRECRKYQYLTLLFVLLLVVGCTIGILVPAGLGWDFANFYDTGRRVASGQIGDLYNPATLIGGEAPQGHLGFWGTPVSAILYVPMSWFGPESALMLFKIQNTLAYFAALALLYFFNRKFVGGSPQAQWQFAATFVFLSLLYQPFWTVYRVGGQTTPTVVMLLSLALVAHTSMRFFVSSALLVIAVLIKPAFVTALIFLMCVSGFRFFGITIAFLSISGLASLMMMGWGVHEAFLSKVLQGVKATYPWFYNSSLYILVEHLRLFASDGPESYFRDALFTLAFLGIKALVVGVFVVIMAKSRDEKWSHAAKSHFDFLMAISFFLLISQTVWEHYLAVLFFLLVYVVASHREFSRGAKVVTVGIVLFAIGQNLILINYLRDQFSFQTIPRLVGICLYKSGPLLLTLLFLWTPRHHSR